MPIFQIFLDLILAGVVLWLVNRFIPMADSIKSILNALVVILVVLWLLNIFGVVPAFGNMHMGRVG